MKIRQYWRTNDQCRSALRGEKCAEKSNMATPLYLVDSAISAIFREQDDDEKFGMIEAVANFKTEDILRSIVMVTKTKPDIVEMDYNYLDDRKCKESVDFINEYYRTHPTHCYSSEKTIKYQ